MKKLIGIALIFCGIFILFGSFLNGMGNWGSPEEKQSHGTASMAEVQLIEINGSSAKINLIPERRKNLEAELTGEHADEYDLIVTDDEQTIEVEIKQQQWFNWFMFNHDLTLDVYVPNTFDKNMAVDMGSGSFDFHGQSNQNPMELNEFELDISSGDVNLGNLNLTELSAEISSGNVDADTIKAETSEIEISSGNVNLTHYTGALSAEISSGQLNTRMSELSAPIEISVSSGSVDLDLPKSANFTLDGDVSSGRIHSDFTLKNEDDGDEDSINGTHGTGKHPIKLEVSSGNINIY